MGIRFGLCGQYLLYRSYIMKMVNFILEKIRGKLCDLYATANSANQIFGKINVLQVIQFLSKNWREINCTTVMNCFAQCGFSNFVSPQPELTSELNV